MSDLTEFLLARIAEDEALAKAATPGPWTAQAGTQVMPPPPWTEQPWWASSVADARRSGGDSEHIARHDPARVLAECEAKRRVVDLWERTRRSAILAGASGGDESVIEDSALTEGLRILATIYADHEDFKDEWRA